ncbi:hypothetical protein KC318_g8164 [Hortaea werneckii]|nr:hypothetical protein KC334_g8144 [Hortaea werneckii]KAI7023302.1 hypothetical protein KC355_g1761 [Hortaea werneckii]KAI7177879.1 hypothetical protein KC324_g9598 [Hortaea werneckii]KAI7592187.1 hypothetical protein KC316_g2441 [Hortaea werneckii]KAI7663730.1 hypothetical protein KC318_g8164 [Hortaea werneckii]
MTTTSEEPPISPVQAEKNKKPDLPSPSSSSAALVISHDDEPPAELDGTPSSPERMRRNSRPRALKDLSPEERDRRIAMHKERENDPAVLVDLPGTPQAEELEKVGVTGRQG